MLRFVVAALSFFRLHRPVVALPYVSFDINFTAAGACRLDGKPGPQIVFPLCLLAEELTETAGGSPCVSAAVKLMAAANVSPIPATYDDWVDSSLPQILDTEEDTPLLKRKLLFNER